jgi:bisphosphoglycerate-independent phosphoglycerate mutase (AlkP superfamily)
MSADFTGLGWRDHLNIHETPIINPDEAGSLLSSLAKCYRFSLFEFWETDIIGHKQNFQNAYQVIEKFDRVLGGILNNWDFENYGILITSYHGNLEDLSTRRHTTNQVPAIFIGRSEIQSIFSENLRSIGDIAPFISELLSD